MTVSNRVVSASRCVISTVASRFASLASHNAGGHVKDEDEDEDDDGDDGRMYSYQKRWTTGVG